jgi:hypothetical protein
MCIIKIKEGKIITQQIINEESGLGMRSLWLYMYLGCFSFSRPGRSSWGTSKLEMKGTRQSEVASIG